MRVLDFLLEINLCFYVFGFEFPCRVSKFSKTYVSIYKDYKVQKTNINTFESYYMHLHYLRDDFLDS